MEKKTSKKRQHFVPQHYLRQFCYAGADQVLAAKVDPYRSLGPVGIKGQCQEDYFYGEDGVTEDTLGEAEDGLAPLLIDVASRARFNPEEEKLLRFLAALLQSRSRKSILAAKQLPLHIGREMVRRGIESGELPEPTGGWKKEMLDFKGTESLLLYVGGVRGWYEMRTLACKILRAPAGSGFITSDNPSMLLNVYCQGYQPSRSFVGYAQTGFQVLLPITPEQYLYFYDPKVYKVGNGKSQVVEITADDVDQLNGLQVHSAENCVYFNEAVPKPTVRALVKKYASERTPLTEALERLPQSTENEEYHRIRPLSVKTPRPFKFSGFRRHISSPRGTFRNAAWTELVGQALEDYKRDPSQEGILAYLDSVSLPG